MCVSLFLGGSCSARVLMIKVQHRGSFGQKLVYFEIANGICEKVSLNECMSTALCKPDFQSRMARRKLIQASPLNKNNIFQRLPFLTEELVPPLPRWPGCTLGFLLGDQLLDIHLAAASDKIHVVGADEWSLVIDLVWDVEDNDDSCGQISSEC